jgi:hypothetical protein
MNNANTKGCKKSSDQAKTLFTLSLVKTCQMTTRCLSLQVYLPINGNCNQDSVNPFHFTVLPKVNSSSSSSSFASFLEISYKMTLIAEMRLLFDDYVYPFIYPRSIKPSNNLTAPDDVGFINCCQCFDHNAASVDFTS